MTRRGSHHGRMRPRQRPFRSESTGASWGCYWRTSQSAGGQPTAIECTDAGGLDSHPRNQCTLVPSVSRELRDVFGVELGTRGAAVLANLGLTCNAASLVDGRRQTLRAAHHAAAGSQRNWCET